MTWIKRPLPLMLGLLWLVGPLLLKLALTAIPFLLSLGSTDGWVFSYAITLQYLSWLLTLWLLPALGLILLGLRRGKMQRA